MDEVHYCEYKVLLKAERFCAPEDFADFRRRVVAVAARCDVVLDRSADDTPGIRNVTFYDTPGSDLYRNAYILRRRVSPEPGAITELTFKFRHPDLAKARQVDVRAHGDLKPDIKFKEEVLQPREGASGARSVYSHNCVLHAEGLMAPPRMDELTTLFPALATLGLAGDTPVALVNHKTIEERQVEMGVLAFGHGLSAKCSAAIWQDLETGRPLTGEFSFQTKFENLAAVDERARDRAEHLHFKVQRALAGWVSGGATKTSLIYGDGVGHE